MKWLKNLPGFGLAIMLTACLIAWLATRDSGAGHNETEPAPANQAPVIDQRLIRTAQLMAALADTAEEQGLARQVLLLTDHELDQAFASALREAATPRPLTGPLQQLAARVAQLKTRVAASQQRIAQLTKDAASQDPDADRSELAKAKLALEEDELEDAQQDLSRQGGDEHARLQRAFQEHETTQHQLSLAPKAVDAVITTTLKDQVQLWLSLNDRNRRLLAARQQAADTASALQREHNSQEGLLQPTPVATTGGPMPATAESSGGDTQNTSAMVAGLQRMSAQRKTLAELDRRIQDCQQLAGVYQRWSGLVETRCRGAIHLMLFSLSAILAILLAVVLVERVIKHAFGHQKTDRKRIHQLRIMAGIGVQLVGAVVILLIVFGPPSQMTTILGLATAGLTVVMKNFIVAFFGWFILMGKNGIHIGDWVEIEGVGGEVIEIGVLKTVLLEMGNWTNSGHPTGRHVSFVNSFAIEGHYFNFSTTGQWLWDELQVMLPSAGDPYRLAEEIRQLVERETEADARQAELDWERVTHQYGTRTFSGKPAVDLRPSINRLDVNVRYITRAPQRYEVKSRLFEKVVEMLHRSAIAKPV